MMGVTCLKLITIGLACMIESPATHEPQAFVYGKAVDRYAMEESTRFNPLMPAVGPLVMLKAEAPRRTARQRATQPRQQAQRPQRQQSAPTRQAEPVAYASSAGASRGLGAIVDRFLNRKADEQPEKLYVRASGNEQMSCVHDNRFLMMMMERMRDKWGKPVIVNSAYRSPSHNKRVRGANRSYHMSCRALDVRIQGVGKDTLARWLRAQPEVGGVGIYCSAYVHFDNGSKRNWDWRNRCR